MHSNSRPFVMFLLGATACSLSSAGLLGSPGDAGTDAYAVDGSVDAFADDGAPDAAIDVAGDDGQLPQASPPDAVGGLTLWLRGDKGVVVNDGGVDGGPPLATWNDQSDAGDPTHNALPPSPQNAPTVVQSNPQYANRATIHFDDLQSLRTGFFSATVTQPATILIVGHTSSGGSTDRYLLDSLHVSTPLSIYTAGTGEIGAALDSVQINAGFSTKNGLATGTTPSIVIVVAAGSNSRLYVSSALPTSMNIGPNGAAGFTIGNWAGGGAFAAKGDIAEVAVWRRALSQAEVDGLNLYAGQRYGIAIK